MTTTSPFIINDSIPQYYSSTIGSEGTSSNGINMQHSRGINLIENPLIWLCVVVVIFIIYKWVWNPRKKYDDDDDSDNEEHSEDDDSDNETSSIEELIQDLQIKQEKLLAGDD